MKPFFLILILFGTIALQGHGQPASSETNSKSNDRFTYGEFKGGYGITRFSTGLNERFEKGNFSRTGGGLFSIAAYRKFGNLNHLQLGLKFKGLNASPSRGDNNNEMFFNFWGTSVSMKYFPLSKNTEKGIYLQGDYNFVTQFTQKYRDTKALQFDHQFAIGSSYTVCMGYQYPLKNRYSILASVEYDLATRRGEVQGIGDVQFKNSNIAFQIGLIF